MTEAQVAFSGTVHKHFKGSKYVPSIHDGIMNAAAKWNLNLPTDDGKRFTDLSFNEPTPRDLATDASKGRQKATMMII